MYLPPITHNLVKRQNGRDGHLLAVPRWALIFGAVPRSDLVVREPQTLCPQCGRALEAGWLNPDGTVPYRCSMFVRCDYLAVRRGDEWLKPPAFWGPWSAPGPERVVERRLETLSFAQARSNPRQDERGQRAAPPDA